MKRLERKGTSRVLIYVVVLAAAVFLMWTLRLCSTPSPSYSREYRASGGDTLDVAIEYSPLSLYEYGDTLGGFNYDLLREMARINGLNLKFHPLVSLNAAIDGLGRGMFDIVVADIPVTLDYQDRFVSTEPVYLDKQVLVQLRDSAGKVDVLSQLELAGREVWVVYNTQAVTSLRNLSAEIGDTIMVRQDSLYGAEQLFLLTAVGEIPRAVINERVARALVSDYPDVDISTAVSFTQFQSWLMRKDDAVALDSINAMLGRFKGSVTYDCLVNRYF